MVPFIEKKASNFDTNLNTTTTTASASSILWFVLLEGSYAHHSATNAHRFVLLKFHLKGKKLSQL